MSVKEDFFNYLKSEGLVPEMLDGVGIRFKYQMFTFFYMEEEEDESFFRLALPGVFDVTEENYPEVLVALNEANNQMKVMKATIFGENGVWLFFELLLDSTPVFDDFVPRALNILMASRDVFYNCMKEE